MRHVQEWGRSFNPRLGEYLPAALFLSFPEALRLRSERKGAGGRDLPHGLSVAGQVKAGETVLVHAGTSGVGTAAIQLVRQAGAIPLVTAGSLDKIKTAEKLGAAAGFNYKERDFSEAVLEFTKGKDLPWLPRATEQELQMWPTRAS